MIQRHRYCILLIIAPLFLVFMPVFFFHRTFVPLDQLHTMNLPYAAQYDSITVQNHFLTDIIAQVYPYKARLQKNFRHGSFALWNTHIFGGHPHYASTSFTHFDPTNIVLLFSDLHLAYHLQLFLKLLLAGLGMYVLLGLYDLLPPIRVLCSTAYMLNSMFIVTLQHQWLVGAMAWMPFCLYFVWRYLDTRYTRHLIYTSLLLALAFLSGSLQTNAICTLLLVVLVVSKIIMQGTVPVFGKKLWNCSWILSAVVIVAIALSAVMLLPSVDLFVQNVNVRLAQQENRQFSMLKGIFSVPLLFSFVFPEILGSVRGYDITKIVQATMNDFAGYIGFAPVFVGLWGLRRIWFLQPHLRPWIIVVICGLFIPLFTPLSKFLYHRTFVVYIAGMVMISAYSFNLLFTNFSEDCTNSFNRWLRRATIFFFIMVSLFLLYSLVILFWKDGVYALIAPILQQKFAQAQFFSESTQTWMIQRIDVFIQHYSLFSKEIFVPLTLIGAILALLHFRDKIGISRSLWLLYGCTITQLLWTAYQWLPLVNIKQHPYYPTTPAIRYLQHHSADSRILLYWDSKALRLLPPNTTEMYGLSIIQGYESIFPRNIYRFGSISTEPSTRELELLGLVGTKYIVGSSYLIFNHPALTRVYEGEGLVIWNNPYLKPHAQMFYSWKVQPDEQKQFEHLMDYSKSLKTLQVFAAPGIAENDRDSGVYTMNVSHKQEGEITLNINTNQAGICMVAETWYPGWEVYVDGIKSPLLKANVACCAVAVPRGQHTVTFRFEPPLLRVGAYISLIALCFGGALIVVDLQRNKK